jgi:hypothetical protein
MEINMKFVLISLCIVLVLLPNSSHAATTVATPALEISGWIPYWRKATGTADVLPNIKVLKEVNPFGYTVTTDGKLYDAAKMDEEPWLTLRRSAKENTVRFIPQ